MTAAQPPRTHLTAVILATFAALIGRAWLQVHLLAKGAQKDYAADLSYLIVPPILFVLLLPVLRRHKRLIGELLAPRRLTARLVLNAVAIGVLLRLSAWCQLIAGISFGFYKNSDPDAIMGPEFSFNCSAPQVVLLGVAVMVVMVPFVEELIHRGLIQTWLADRGPIVAIALSSLLFMLVHKQSTWGFAFLAGLVFGFQFWRTRTIWFSVITHATVNGLIQIDWRCVHGQWNPQASQVPVWGTGITSILVLLLAIFALTRLLIAKTAGAQSAPRP